MCGICGEVRRLGRGTPDARVLEEMNAAQVHRGPDDGGVWLDGPAGLGHRRLAIIDLSANGHQPMADAAGLAALTFNGEIYNYIELRRELASHGHCFVGSSDTEVLLHGYLEWGTGVLDRLNGMYAFALFDRRQRRLFAARDPIGQKPFHYFVRSEALVFASELTALLRHPLAPKTLDREATAHYLVFDAFPAPLTPIEGVLKLRPGHALLYDADSGSLRTYSYRNPIGAPPPTTAKAPTPAEIDEFGQVLGEAVGRHLRSDVPVGIYLSGGLDSTSLVMAAADLVGGERIQTFTVASDDETFNEADEARATAELFGTQHREILVTGSEAAETVPQLLERLDEPIADPGLVAVYQVSRAAARHVKVVLSGNGGDELFYGYAPFAKWGLSEALGRLPRWVSAGFLPWAVGQLPADFGYMGLGTKASIFLRGIGRPREIRNSTWYGSFLPEEAREFLEDGAKLTSLSSDPGELEPLYGELLALHRSARDHDPLSRLGREYQATYLPNCICAHTDKASMLVSLEARSPYLDRELMRYANGLPAAWKVRGGVGKWIVRRYLEKRLGASSVAAKKKQGYSVPIARWMRQDLRPLIGDALSASSLARIGLFSPEPVQTIWKEHQAGRVNHYKKLWAIFVLQSWCMRNLL